MRREHLFCALVVRGGKTKISEIQMLTITPYTSA